MSCAHDRLLTAVAATTPRVMRTGTAVTFDRDQFSEALPCEIQRQSHDVT
jgi:hypothetical protein